MRAAGAGVALTACLLLSAGQAPTADVATASGTGGGLTVGETVSHVLYTHCGVEATRINGRWWHVTSPLYGPGGEGSGPPAGWDDFQQPGELRMVADDRAVFVAVGHQVELRPASADEPVRVCR